MDSRRFDSITRRFGAKTSRKQVLKALAGGSVAAVAGVLRGGRAEAARTHFCCGYQCGSAPFISFTSKCAVQHVCPFIENCQAVGITRVRNCSDCSFQGF
jgi:hypothetical protein